MSGPPPKPAHLRQRTNKKSTHATLEVVDGAKPRPAPPIPNPDGRTWHPLTLKAWEKAWNSPMASQWLDTDVDGLGQLALLWDQLYKEPERADKLLPEIRLQRQCFGLTPLDRSRLQWEVNRADESERRKPKPAPKRTGTDPRAVLMAVK